MADERSLFTDEAADLVGVPADALRHVIVLVVGRAVHLRAPGLHACGRDVIGTRIQAGDIFTLAGDEVVVIVQARGTLSVSILQVRRGNHLVRREAGLDADAEDRILALGVLRGDDDGAVGRLRTVEGRSGGTLQHGDAFDVVRVDIGKAVTIVDGVDASFTGIGLGGGVVHRHAVHDEQGRVVLQVRRGLTADRDAHGAVGAAGTVDVQTGHLTGHTVDPVARRGAADAEFIELHSHSDNLHNQGDCNIGQGGGIQCLSEETIQKDLKASRDKLNGTTYFCYPFYEYNEYSIRMLKQAGFTMAFDGEKSYGDNLVHPGDDKFRLRRFVIVTYTTLSDFDTYFGGIK